MSTSIDQAFIRQYESEVHVAYQRMGSKLRGSVRTKNGVKGKSTTFQKVGKGTAGQKTRHGKVPVMNVDHGTVECTLGDWYAGDWVDKLDEAKTNVDERQVLVNAGAYALGRKTDELLFDAAALGTFQTAVTVGPPGASGNQGMNVEKIMSALAAMGNRDAPVDDGNMFLPVGWQEWTELMQDERFSSQDYVGPDEMPFKGKGMFGKRYMGVLVYAHSGVPVVTATDIASNFMYHKNALGHAIGVDVTADITWHGDYASHFINNMMSMGACLIDDNGVQEILTDRSP